MYIRETKTLSVGTDKLNSQPVRETYAGVRCGSVWNFPVFQLSLNDTQFPSPLAILPSSSFYSRSTKQQQARLNHQFDGIHTKLLTRKSAQNSQSLGNFFVTQIYTDTNILNP